MKYYKQTENHTLQILMEILKEETQNNPMWTLQGLFALCRDVSLLDDVPENADYFDEIYLTFAELLSEFNHYGQLVDVPDALKKVCGFITDEAAKDELLSALNALHSGTIQGRTRSLTAKWEAEGTWQNWQQHIVELQSEIADVLPVQARTDLDEIEAAVEGRPKKDKKGKRGKKMTALILVISLAFTWFSLYLSLQGAGVTYSVLSLRTQGQKATAEVIQIASEMRPQKTNRIQERTEYTYLEVVKFTTDAGKEVQSRLYGKGESESRYSVGDTVEIYYNPEAPAQITDANSHAQLVKGVVTIAFGLFILIVIASLSRGLFSSMGSFGVVISIGSKAVLLALAFSLLVYQNIYELYRYFPATDEAECVNSGGIVVQKGDMKPFSGLMRSCTENSMSLYSYKDGELDGLNVVYYDGIVKETGHWKKGKQNGQFALYTTGGILIDYANFEDGERHGLTWQYDPETGSVTHIGNYQHGEMDGRWVAYNPDTGYILMEQTYREGVLHGPAKQYYSDGRLQIDMNFEDGVAQGAYKSYYPSGQLQVEDNLENGSYSSQVKMYNEDGTPMEIFLSPSGDSSADSDESGITITETDDD